MRGTAHEHQKAVHAIEAASYGAVTTDGPAIDRLGFAEALIVMNVGVIAAGGTLDAKIQESDTSGGTYTDVTGAAFAQVLTAGDQKTYVGRLNLDGRKRFIRVRSVTAVAAVIVAVDAILSQPDNLAVTQQNTLGFNV